ncbi:MAG: NifB/NifX family molybdenum-iron cluster-binding protein [Sulfurimonas sp.]|jgi:predicted Fe-Mo cluster-binding NifX family protein|nr:NifB/NifX family molybdenum-iron cluster-binding protein [Sulfurimonas sp.]
MIAIPVKTDKENPAVTTLFGKAKWFAIVDNDKITIEKNELQSGRTVVESFVSRGITKIIFNHMGGNPFMLLQKANIECYHSGDDRIELSDAIKKLNSGELIKVDSSNMSKFVELESMHKGKGHKDHDHSH